ncbi:MAG: energy-coupled thiamine transporter ThiT [Lachnospiraceae bacterium]|nr:energy-coupled thiamine transporter ThiT [Lachnospiraceae bacterium]
MENRNQNLVAMVECALFVAAAVVLDFITIFELPNGGSLKFVMIPLIIFALRRGFKWGTVSGILYLVIAIILGREGIFYPGSTATVIVVCILFDYVLAYSTIGLAPVFAKLFKNRMLGVGASAFLVCLVRFLSHFISGTTIWGDFSNGAGGAILFSITYNGSYMLPIAVVSAVVMVLIYKFAPQLFFVNETVTNTAVDSEKVTSIDSKKASKKTAKRENAKIKEA